MKKIMFIGLLLLFSIGLVGCNSNQDTPAAPEKNNQTENAKDTGATCGQPPAQVEWNGKSYQLKEKDTSAEPGTKFGYLQCEDGNYSATQTDDQITVYSYGNPNNNAGIIIYAPWGHALYTLK